MDTHKPQTIKFFIVSRESRGVELLTATEITLDVTCGLVSTTILAPSILPVTVNDYYLMRGLDQNYNMTTSFTNSNEANCPVTSFGIVPVGAGTVADWTSTDGVTLVTLTTAVPQHGFMLFRIPLI